MANPRTLFLQHEQRQFYWEEPGHLELYLPMVNSGLLGEVRSLPYQRDLRYLRYKIKDQAHKYPNVKQLIDARDSIAKEQPGGIDGNQLNQIIENLIEAIAMSELSGVINSVISEFRPDVVVYALTWPTEAVPIPILEALKEKHKFKLFSVIWDYDEQNKLLMNYDQAVIRISDLVAVADSYYRAERIRNKEGVYSNFTNVDVVRFMPMIADPSLFLPNTCKKYDVSLAGSSEGYRNEIYKYLLTNGININRIGGLMPTDKYLSHQEYARAIAESKIVINTQTQNERVQLKGRVSQVLTSGSLLLEQWSREGEQFLTPMHLDKLMWKTPEELMDMIEYWLSHPEQCLALAQQARETYINQYNPVTWTTSVLKNLGRLN